MNENRFNPDEESIFSNNDFEYVYIVSNKDVNKLIELRNKYDESIPDENLIDVSIVKKKEFNSGEPYNVIEKKRCRGKYISNNDGRIH